ALAEAYARGELSPRAVLDAVLERIARVNPQLNAIVTLDERGARAAAQASEQRWRAGAPLGPLDGVPLTVKDNIPVRGLRATWGTGFMPTSFLPATSCRSRACARPARSFSARRTSPSSRCRATPTTRCLGRRAIHGISR